jgi:signal transduction histidine kinase
MIELKISDTGQGIEPTFLPHIFERFNQADSSSTRQHGGLGLGLAICRQIVEVYGGKIEVESGGAGKGTAFTVKLPFTSKSSL